MDKIWDRKSLEVGGHWPVWRGWKKRMTTQNRQKSNAKKNKNWITNVFICLFFLYKVHTYYLQLYHRNINGNDNSWPLHNLPTLTTVLVRKGKLLRYKGFLNKEKGDNSQQTVLMTQYVWTCNASDL